MARQYAQVEPLDVVPGEPLPWDVFNRTGFLLLRRGSVVNRQDQLDRLIEGGLYAVAVELEETRALRQGVGPVELPSSWLHIAECRKGLEAAYVACRVRAEDFPARMDRLVTLVDEALDINPHVALAAIYLKRQEPYAHRHPVDAATVASLICRTLNQPETERRSLIAAALSMNFAQFETQDALNKQAGLLDADTLAELHCHPKASHDMLKDAGIDDPIWLEAVLRHHERHDGGGYPQGLTGQAIGEPGQLLALADWFTARQQPRADRAPQLPPNVVKLAQAEAGRTFHPSLPMVLARAVGMYPAGSWVKLSNGEIAIVACQTARAESPIVYTIKTPRGPIAHPIKRETDLDAHTLREAVDPNHVVLDKPIRLVDLWGKDAEGG
jgi:HD-GYP domain-containing protein (c-di-GMP phosphodiesterase class II)